MCGIFRVALSRSLLLSRRHLQTLLSTQSVIICVFSRVSLSPNANSWSRDRTRVQDLLVRQLSSCHPPKWMGIIMATSYKPRQCSMCPMTFNEEWELRRHEPRHSSNDKFQCASCTWSTKNPGSLVTHRKVAHNEHAGGNSTMPPSVSTVLVQMPQTGENPYECNLCGSSFDRQEDLNQHNQKQHDDEAQYGCQSCGESFVYPFSLREHEAIRHSTNRLLCEICEKRFSKKSALCRHRREIHEGKKRFRGLRRTRKTTSTTSDSEHETLDCMTKSMPGFNYPTPQYSQMDYPAPSANGAVEATQTTGSYATLFVTTPMRSSPGTLFTSTVADTNDLSTEGDAEQPWDTSCNNAFFDHSSAKDAAQLWNSAFVDLNLCDELSTEGDAEQPWDTSCNNAFFDHSSAKDAAQFWNSAFIDLNLCDELSTKKDVAQLCDPFCVDPCLDDAFSTKGDAEQPTDTVNIAPFLLNNSSTNEDTAPSGAHPVLRGQESEEENKSAAIDTNASRQVVRASRKTSVYRKTKHWCTMGCKQRGFSRKEHLTRHIKDFHLRLDVVECPCCPEDNRKVFVGRRDNFMIHLARHITGARRVSYHPKAAEIWEEERQKSRPRAPSSSRKDNPSAIRRQGRSSGVARTRGIVSSIEELDQVAEE
ncbi:hypothetical protein GE09DRAFT_630353 [Coniochaeta sp. 2T2.1]|nr:hypothetical protein GE09DRAFT_630353 [Coniochaeta sp. 2T2.1]